MKKLFQNTSILAVIFATMFGIPKNAQSLEINSLTSAAGAVIPVRQVVVYDNQTVPYTNFNAAIFAQGQLKYVPQLPAGSEVAFYVDENKVNGPVGVLRGTRCSATQAKAAYYQNTITLDRRFCLDFNDAILDRKAVYGIIPTEAVFLHKGNGQRCSTAGNGGAIYLTNPASQFYRNYLVNRVNRKLAQFKMDTLFLDDLQVGWSEITSVCGGNPKEYSNIDAYFTQTVGLTQYVHNNLPAYKIEGNLATVSPRWDRFAFFNGAMCENCFTNWGRTWPSPARMLSDLSLMNKWVKSGHKIYVISQAPDTSAASNRFTFAASLLIANNNRVYFHFSANYRQFYSIPEYKYDLGLPITDYVCNGSICTRKFERGRVAVDFAAKKGSIILNNMSNMQAAPTLTLPANLIMESPTVTLTSITTSTSPTIMPVTIESNPTQTMESPATQVIIPTDTPVPTVILPTPTTESIIPLETLPFAVP